jgi:CubicO group peptidase (beta-lactamase class C family)
LWRLVSFVGDFMQKDVIGADGIYRLVQFLNAWLPFRLDNSDVTGVSVAVCVGGDEVYSNAFGVADVDSNETLTADHVMDVASQTKMFTGLAVLSLHGRHVLDMFDDVVDVLPELENVHPFFRETRGRLTPYNLLTHQALLPRDFLPGTEPLALHDAVTRTLESQGRAVAPRYSNIGYAVLAEAVERVCDQPFEEVLSEQIFRPLGMERTFASVDRIVGPRATGYGPVRESVRRKLDTDAPLHSRGAIGIWSTPSDLCRLGSALVSGRPPADPVLATMQQSVQWGPSAATGFTEFGLGLEGRRIDGTRYFGHSGGANGFASATYFHAPSGVVVSLAINSRDVGVLEDLSAGLVSAVHFFCRGTESTSDAVRRFEGRFAGTISVSEVIASGSAVAMVDPLHWNPFRRTLNLRMVSDARLVVTNGDFNFGGMPVDFVFDGDGCAEVVHLGGQQLSRCDN